MRLFLVVFSVFPFPTPVNGDIHLRLRIAGRLDGSGSHRIYNQLPPHPDMSTDNFFLFGFKIITYCYSSIPVNRWSNPIPNSPIYTSTRCSLHTRRESFQCKIFDGYFNLIMKLLTSGIIEFISIEDTLKLRLYDHGLMKRWPNCVMVLEEPAVNCVQHPKVI